MCQSGYHREGKYIRGDIDMVVNVFEKLQELQELHKAKTGDEDNWRAYSYNKSKYE